MHLTTFMLTSRRLRDKEEQGRAKEAEEIVDQLQIIWCRTNAICSPDDLVKTP